MMGFQFTSLILILVQGLNFALMVLAFYALILVIKALQIYIRKNRDY